MFEHFDGRFCKRMIVVQPGEWFASGEDIIIATVLGSCVSVLLYDERLKIGGLNHFMLADSQGRDDSIFGPSSAKYGFYAMEYLIAEMQKMGSTRASLKAKVFGGGSVLSGSVAIKTSVPQRNIEFALSYLKADGIPIVSKDLGGTKARKLFFFPSTFRVLLKRFGGEGLYAVEKAEEGYLEKIKKEGEEGRVVLF
jgi:chemotaxis protein CheD